MDAFVTVMVIALIVCIITIIIGVSVSSAKKGRARRERQQKEQETEQKHGWNTNYLYQVGFRMEEIYNPKSSRVHLYFDYTNKNVALEYYEPKLFCSDIIFFPIDKIVECDLIQDGTVVSREEGKLAGATMWGFGSVSGVKEAYTDSLVGVLAVRLLIDDIRVPSVTINILETAISKASQLYQQYFFVVQEIYGKFQGIVRINTAERLRVAQQAAPKPSQLPESILNQVRQLAQLKDEGILTEQEFDAKKKLLMEKIN